MANIDISGIDWKLLRLQKLWLIDQDNIVADGLVEFISHIQDSSVGWGPSEVLVFGKVDDNGHYILENFDEYRLEASVAAIALAAS